MPRFQVGDEVRLLVREVDHNDGPGYISSMQRNAEARLVFVVDELYDDSWCGISHESTGGEDDENWTVDESWLVPVNKKKKKIDMRNVRRY